MPNTTKTFKHRLDLTIREIKKEYDHAIANQDADRAERMDALYTEFVMMRNAENAAIARCHAAS